ncbi:D-lactate dehydrogenase (cytochrome) [Deinococcus metalli]|uniref:D-lactate dehydrogenase (cytochrome) n=1 Tax=Deinococcus metalli TaxID=1141878 RepID=A0A7W8KGK8_9DEIO|nr:FAD-linked oxidase C-terminal domain-containing protein [Deinococcus metalli]MBB5377829.1 D-lactate dehydrogenase (cytochrome) [Deinococcus metalli]GHF55634.1 oxidoreductase [Deinococcus metalli]
MNTAALEALRARYGERLSTAAPVLEAHGRDESHPTVHPPHAVLFAHSEADVVDALRLASEHGFPVTPFAVGSSLEGQVIPVQGGLSLDVSQLNRVLSIEPGGFQATVQPGVTYPQLNRQVRPHGLFFPVDPGAEASLGGMASTNASGTGAVRYGTTRDNVLELRVALMDGTVIRAGSKARKTSAGYDLKNVFIGAEGTLGIITELTVKLWPLPAHVVVVRCTFPTVQAAAACAVMVMGAALQPERLELIDEHEIHAVNAYEGTAYPEAPTLWIELAAPSASALEETLAVCVELCEDAGAQHLDTARSAAERAKVWEARHHAYHAMSALYPGHARLSTDLCVPLHRLPDVLGAAREACDAASLRASFVGHVGDGNFHVLFHAPPDDAATWAAIHRVYDDMVELALAAGGTCSGEHGVGLHKRGYLAREHGDSLHVMRGLKALFDPRGLLNPGKILP